MVTDAEISAFWRDGYAVFPNVIPESLCTRVIDDVLASAGIDQQDPNTWYQDNFAGHGIVPVHHTQAMWDVRQHPRVHEVFSALYGTDALWVSMDRLSYKPPAADQSSHWQRASVHWDCDPWQWRGRSLQALVYLTETTAEQGAFACAPDIYSDLPAYLQANEANPNRRYPDLSDQQLHAVAAPAGSLIVFSRLMPHTSLLNRSSLHRFVQYVTMQPVPQSGVAELRAERVKEWQDKMPPEWAIAQQVAGQRIPESGAPATLTPLGKKLVGVEPWQ